MKLRRSYIVRGSPLIHRKLAHSLDKLSLAKLAVGIRVVRCKELPHGLAELATSDLVEGFCIALQASTELIEIYKTVVVGVQRIESSLKHLVVLLPHRGKHYVFELFKRYLIISIKVRGLHNFGEFRSSALLLE